MANSNDTLRPKNGQPDLSNLISVFNFHKKKIGKQKPLISGIKLKDYFLSDLASFSRQVAMTQAEKLVFSFLACFSICSIKSWGKRISLRFDLLVSFAIFIPKKYLLVCKHYT